MKPPNMAPLYVHIWEQATEAARSCGYALAIHGSLARDLDLVAIPWTDEAVPAEDLVKRVADATAWQFTDGTPYFIGPFNKPHGRRCWTLPYMATWFVDLSVMPRSGSDSRDPGGIGEGGL